jgi:hypothetical protein
MTAPHLGTTLQPPFTRAVSMQALLADQPPVRDVGTNLDEIRVGRRLVVLDDDPTGTQCVADLPVLTRWSVPDLQWAFQQPTTGFFVLTNTRSLSEADADERNRGEIENRHLRQRHGDRDRGRPLVPRATAPCCGRTTAVL